MPLQFSTTIRNARADQIESSTGASAILRMYSGSKPADCAAASTGTLLAEMALPADWMAAAANGVKAKSGTWEDAAANAGGNLGYFRIFDSTGTTCHVQGTITATGGGGDMTVDNVSVAVDQKITVTTFSITEGNA